MLHLELIWMESHQVRYLLILQVKFLVGDPSKGHGGHSRSPTVFLPITWDPNEIETWNLCHCVCLRKAQRMMYNLTYLGHRSDLALTWHEVKFWPWPFKVKLYMVRRALTRQTRWYQNTCSTFNPSPPGLLAHPWVPGGAYHAPPPLLSREPLFVESRARRRSKALDKTLQNHLSELKIEVTCKVKVRSNVKIRRFNVLGPGDQDYRTWWLKLRHNVVKCMVKVWYEYKWHTKKT